MTARKLLHETFRLGVAIKGIDGLLETIGGVLLWLVKPAEMSRVARFLFQHELAEDPHDFVANHILHFQAGLTHNSLIFASAYLLAHGFVKIVLAIALWMNELWAYPLAIAVFGAFTVYQTYRYTGTHSLALLVLTVLDVAILWLTWKEWRVQKTDKRRPR